MSGDGGAVGDVDGDGLGDLAVSSDVQAAAGMAVERRVFVFAGNAKSGPVESAAWLTVSSDECGRLAGDEDGTYWYCDVGLTPVEAGDVDGDGRAELVLQGVYASGEQDDTQAAVILDAGSGSFELGPESAGVVWLDAGVEAHWQPESGVVTAGLQGGFSADYDADGFLDLFLFTAGDDAGTYVNEYLLGFRGPIE